MSNGEMELNGAVQVLLTAIADRVVKKIESSKPGYHDVTDLYEDAAEPPEPEPPEPPTDELTRPIGVDQWRIVNEDNKRMRVALEEIHGTTASATVGDIARRGLGDA